MTLVMLGIYSQFGATAEISSLQLLFSAFVDKVDGLLHMCVATEISGQQSSH